MRVTLGIKSFEPQTPLASLGGGSTRGVLVAGVLRDVYRRVVADELRWTVDEYHRAIDAGVFDDRRVELL